VNEGIWRTNYYSSEAMIDRKTIVACFFLVAAFILSTPEHIGAKEKKVAPVAAPHEAQSCEDCHSVHGMKLLDDSGRSCLKCHEDAAGKDSHPTSIAHEGEPPEGLPLSKDGTITCYTCHVLHETTPVVDGLLRKEFDALCMTCHFPSTLNKSDSKQAE